MWPTGPTLPVTKQDGDGESTVTSRNVKVFWNLDYSHGGVMGIKTQLEWIQERTGGEFMETKNV